MVLSNNPDKNILDPLIEENPIHDILKSFGANIEELHKPIDFDDWTRWGKNNRYSARLIRGVVGDEGLIYRDFTSSEKPKVVFFNNLRDPSEEELFFRESMTEQAYQEADLETQRKHEEAAISANQLWEEARIEGASEYLNKKQVMAYGLRFSEDQHGRFVMVPLYDASGKLWNVQKIYDPRPNGSNNKWFVTGGRKKGCFYLFGASLSNLVNQDGIAETFVVCEGYATGASIHAATGLPVVVAFDCGNLEPVVASLKEAFPALNIVIAADNDQWNENGDNKGLVEAHKASSKHGCTVVYPQFQPEHHKFKPTDFNDLHDLEGLEAIKKRIQLRIDTTLEEGNDSVLDSGDSGKTQREWAEPLPIPTSELLPVEVFDCDKLLPPVLRGFVKDCAYRTQTPPDLIASPLMGMFSALLGANYRMHPKQYDDWAEVPNLWSMIIATPGSMKTYCLSEALKPMKFLAATARQTYDEELEVYQRDFKCYEIEQKALNSVLREAIKKKMKSRSSEQSENLDAMIKDYRAQMEALYKPEYPFEKRYMTSDSTIEMLQELLKRNAAGLLVERDEIISLLVTFEMSGREADRGFYLAGWNGGGDYHVDRIGRGSTYVPHLCLSIVGTTQPEKIQAYISKNTAALANDGLIQRFQLMVYPNPLPERKYIDQWPSTGAKNAVYDVVKTISQSDFLREHKQALNAHFKKKDDSNEEELLIIPFRFDKPAQKLFKQWFEGLEKKIDAEEETIIKEHLSKYRGLIPSLALILHVVGIASSDSKEYSPVSLESLQRAILWHSYLESHARRIYSMGMNSSSEKAVLALSNKLLKGAVEDGFSVRAIYRKNYKGLGRDSDLIKEACEELRELNWLRSTLIPASKQQAATTTYHINPAIQSGRFKNSAVTPSMVNPFPTLATNEADTFEDNDDSFFADHISQESVHPLPLQTTTYEEEYI